MLNILTKCSALTQTISNSLSPILKAMYVWPPDSIAGRRPLYFTEVPYILAYKSPP